MQMSYSYVSDVPFKNVYKLAKRAETIRNYQKQVLPMIKHCLGKSEINTIMEKRSFLHNFSLQDKHKGLLVQREQMLFTQIAKWKEFSILKNSPFPLTQSIKVYRRALVLFPCLIPCHRCEKSARESCNSHHLMTQLDSMHARTNDTCVDQCGYMKSG